MKSFIFLLIGFYPLVAFSCPKGVDEFGRIVEREIDNNLEAQVDAVTSAQIGVNNEAKLGVAGAGSQDSRIAAFDVDTVDEIHMVEREINAAATASTQDTKLFKPDLDSVDELEKADRKFLKYKREIKTSDEVVAEATRKKLPVDSAEYRSQIRSKPSVERFKSKYAKSQLEFENRRFISEIGKTPPGKKSVYFDVENSVLKDLNDNIFESKDLGDAAGNLFNSILYGKIKSDPKLATRLDGKYRDFKSMRFRFLLDEGEDATALNNALKKAYGEAAAEFEVKLSATGLKELWATRSGQTGNPRKWFLAGTGSNPLEANMAARQARGMLEEMGTSNRLVEYASRVDSLSKDIKDLEKIRTLLSRMPELKKAGVLVDSGNGKFILSKDMIGILRKTKRGDFSSLKDYRKAIRKQARGLFGVKLDKVAIDGMTKYFEGVDALSPPLFIRSRNGIDLSSANSGLVSVDFTGVGVDNAFEAMNGLLKATTEGAGNKKLVEGALKSIDDHVENVTESMNRSKRAFNDGTQHVSGAEKPAVFSGDDGMYFPDKPWTRSEKQKLVDKLGGEDPSKYRVTFVETKYKNGKPIPADLRSEYIVKAEKVEKAIRKAVTGLGEGQISPERAREMMIAIEYKPAQAGKSDWDILFGGKINHHEQTILRRSLEAIIEADH
ncbi:MAG: hypothetical protein CME70_22950 [Halobacteriovorax sp.]|nr:hypothetical protein [Halobacteriovorax sp.]